jgi:PilZ domain
VAVPEDGLEDFMTRLNTAGAPSQPASAGIERRAWVRYPCERETTCQPVSTSGGPQWTGLAKDLSAGGIGLVLSRRFELRTLLTVQIQGPDGQPSRPFWARVVHVHQRADGSWLMGCAFTSELSEDELNQLL